MATINYNGMELEEFAPEDNRFFNPPVKAVFINADHVPIREKMLYSFDKRFKCPFTDEENLCWPHCALLPDPPVPRRATNRELARWLIEGNAQIRHSDSDMVYVGWNYKEFEDDFPCSNNVLVRKWSDTEWHEPTVDYLFGETYKEAK